jgi:hypothetical protein
MASAVLVDNDVALKIACYSLVDETLKATTVGDVPPAMLGVARFVIRGRLARARDIVDAERACAAFERLLQASSLVEPDEGELAFAADLEAEAIRRDVELDGGESQLLAILATRGCRLLLTGDKRAIAAVAGIALEQVARRIACLEQLIAHIIGMVGATAVRTAVCSEPTTDRAITLCFSCGEQTAPVDGDLLAALASYAGHVDRAAPGMLLPGPDLAALAV